MHLEIVIYIGIMFEDVELGSIKSALSSVQIP